MGTLTISGVSRAFGSKRRSEPVLALDSIDLHVDQGELVCIVGASGCGKSTLLHLVGGLDTPTSGEIRVGGDLVVGPGPDRGMVFQAYSLFPWKTVAANVAFGLRGARWNKERVAERVAELLGIMELSAWADHKPAQLSGGMRQRVAIARALAPEPDVLLLDEPFGALDAQTKRTMHDFLLHVQTRTGATILMVTHDVAEAVYLSQRIYVFSAHPGRVAEEVVACSATPGSSTCATRSRTSSGPTRELPPTSRPSVPPEDAPSGCRRPIANAATPQRSRGLHR
jgi:NitT/TauT family transport system ATP-binding protein